MSGIQRFLSKREKHGTHHGSRHHDQYHDQTKDKVNTPSSLAERPARFSCPLLVPISLIRSWGSRDDSPPSRSRSSLSMLSGQSATEGQYEAALCESGANSSESSSSQLTPPATAHYNSLFASDDTHAPEKDEDKKVKTLAQRVARTGIGDLKEPQIRYALRSKYANGDPDKAYDFLMLMEDAVEGILRDYNPDVKLLGAENRNGVTCYLDALLFGMFARLDSFEAILYNSFDDEPRRKLSTILRLWVNMLRSGKLITTDLTKQLQEALAECGWEDAALLCQQDASEAFTFITEKLELPLLTLKMDIYHTGREDTTDDHKFINERLLEVAIPSDPGTGKTITLEDCLETYFNNRIEIRRYLERRHTTNSVRSADSTMGVAAHVEEVDSRQSSPSRSSMYGRSGGEPSTPITPGSPGRQPMRHRAPSILQERFIPDRSDPFDSETIDWNDETKGRSRKGSVRKEVMMPAWQFFSLIPWYTGSAPTDDTQIAAHFSSKRPVLGLCLKRYSMLPNGRAVRLNTHIDIPIEIGLPHFIKDDRMDEEAPIYGNFKLSLQSIVCHRGVSVDSGHYIALVRGTAPNAETKDGPVGTNEKRKPNHGSWMRFDDLAKERITLVDIEKAMKDESPYLLFYQIVPIEGDPGHIADGERPPSYTDSFGRDSGIAGLSMSGLRTDGPSDVAPGSGRPSFEITDFEEPRGRSSFTGDRRPSVAFTDSSLQSAEGGLRPDPSSNLPATATPKQGGHSPNPSRRSSVFSKSKTRSNPGSRSQSQSGDVRIGSTFSKMAARLSREKLDKIESQGTDGGAYTSTVAVTPVPAPATTEKPVRGPVAATIRPTPRLSEKAAQKEAKREKSKNRLSKHHVHDGKGKPDRECVLM